MYVNCVIFNYDDEYRPVIESHIFVLAAKKFVAQTGNNTVLFVNTNR